MSSPLALFSDLTGYALSMHVADFKTATAYLAPDLTARLTLVGKRRRGDKRVIFTLAVGRPNYLERKFIRACKKAGEKFPVKKVQLRAPAKKRAA